MHLFIVLDHSTPVGFHKCFELATLPSEEKIYTTAKELIEY